MSTYTERREEEVVVESISTSGINFGVWGGYAPGREIARQIQVGESLVVETRGSQVTGLRRGDVWIYHHSDEKLMEDHQRLLDSFAKRRRDMLEEHREDWERREAKLPSHLRERLENFRAKGDNFDEDGWGYELVICELAEIYARNGGVDDDEINAYSDQEGTSGNQHDFAKVIAREMIRDGGLDPKQIIAGIAPLTGSADYSNMAG